MKEMKWICIAQRNLKKLLIYRSAKQSKAHLLEKLRQILFELRYLELIDSKILRFWIELSLLSVFAACGKVLIRIQVEKNAFHFRELKSEIK